MKIDYESEGGYGGLRIKATIDSEALPAEQAEQLQTLVEDVRALGPTPALDESQGRRVADAQSYRVTIHDQGNAYVLRCTDADMPDRARPLLALLRKLAIQSKRV